MKKGITLVTLLITLIVMIVLSTTVVVSGVSAMNNAKKMKFAAELVFMQDTIQNYMRTHENSLPVKDGVVAVQNLPEREYYEIDMSLLGLIDTAYGNKLNADEKDIYVVSKTNNEVYYLKGLKIGNTIYYNLTDELKESINYTDTNAVSKDGIIFNQSKTDYTNSDISVNVQVPKEYSNVTVVSGNTEITEFAIEGKYIVFTISEASNFNIAVLYTKDGAQLQQTHSVSNFDNVAPTIEIKEKIKITSDNKEKTSITINTTDDLSGVDKVLYTTDKVEKTYFETENKGKQVTNNNVVVDKFTKYVTFYVVDKAGNSKILVETLDATATENDYAKYGLILHYDAINNTGNGHSNTTTVWKDLSGNGNNGTLTNFNNTTSSGWSDNYLLFDGVDDKVLTELFNSTGDFTIEIKVADTEIVSALNYGGCFTINTWSTSVTEPSIICFQNLNGSTRLFGTLVPPQENLPYDERTFAMVNINKDTLSMTKSKDKIVSYYNGNVIATSAETSYITRLFLDNIKLYIGNYNGGAYIKQKVYSMRIYNRALTEDEIEQNYKVDKIRFGI